LFIFMLKLLLGAREDVKEGSRPFDRNAALGDIGDIGGERTPFVPDAPLVLTVWGDFGDAMLGDWSVFCSERVGVLGVIDVLVKRSDVMGVCGIDGMGKLELGSSTFAGSWTFGSTARVVTTAVGCCTSCVFGADEGLPDSDGDLNMASETGRGLGVGVEGPDATTSSDTGLGIRLGVDSVDRDDSLLFTGGIEGVELSEAFNEGR
jgi:hypothetical protein